MNKLLLILLSPVLSGISAAAETIEPVPVALSSKAMQLSAAVTATPVSYDYGMQQRRRGDYAGAKETFLKLLEKYPGSGGAYEGLVLTCHSLGQYEEALGYLNLWEAQSPCNAYILGLRARAQNGQRDEDAAQQTYKEMVKCDPRDCTVRGRLDSSLERLRAGVFPFGKSYKSYSMEGLDTSRPQRILYEGHSGGSRFRAPLKPGLDLIGGVEIREEAQRNDGGGFTYYDILEQIYSAGLSGRPSRVLNWEAEYGHSVLSELNSPGVGSKLLSRTRLAGELRAYDSDFRLTLTRTPKFLRDESGSARYFKLLQTTAVRAEAESYRLNWNWLARAGLYDNSDGTAMGSYSLRGIREFGRNVFQSAFSHGQEEFYSASADGRLRYVNTDRLSLSLRHTVEERYRVGASYSRAFYSDTNRLHEFGGELTGWLPGYKEFSGSYRFSLQNFRAPHEGYPSTDERAQWLGAYWRHCRGRNWSVMTGYERGFLNDSRGSYQGNRYLAEAEWYRWTSGSIRLQGTGRNTSVGDKAYSAGLQARYSFQ